MGGADDTHAGVWAAAVTVSLAQRDMAEDAFSALAEEPLALSLEDRRNGTWAVSALFAEEPDGSALANALAAAGIENRARVSRVPDRDWVREVQARLHPISAGRYFVHGSHDRATRPATGLSIEIDAQAAFGTGHHDSTRGCLMALTALRRSGAKIKRALDLGTGSGVLAIAVARTWPAQVLASDMDAQSVPIARTNARANECGNRVRILEANGFKHPDLARAENFDLVLANILARPNILLAPRIARAVARGGFVILAGHLVTEEARVLAAYRNHGLTLSHRFRLGEWSTLILMRPPGLRET